MFLRNTAKENHARGLVLLKEPFGIVLLKEPFGIIPVFYIWLTNMFKKYLLRKKKKKKF